MDAAVLPRSGSIKELLKSGFGLTTTFADDYIIVLAWSLAIGQTVMVYLYSLKSWQGYHYYDIPKLSIEDRMQASRYDLANQLLYNPILVLVKASIIFFLWRLRDKRKAIRWSLISFRQWT